jgi:thiol-disulfide isomerase/thioredoxin
VSLLALAVFTELTLRLRAALTVQGSGRVNCVFVKPSVFSGDWRVHPRAMQYKLDAILQKRKRDRIKLTPMAKGEPLLLSRHWLPLFLLFCVLRPRSCAASGGGGGEEPAQFEIPRDGRVVELDESNFDAAVRAADFLFVDFYAPWCGHCKRLAPQVTDATRLSSAGATWVMGAMPAGCRCLRWVK